MPPFAVPQLGSCASSGRAWQLWAARHSQGEAGPLGARPLLELAASNAADVTPRLTPQAENMKTFFKLLHCEARYYYYY